MGYNALVREMFVWFELVFMTIFKHSEFPSDIVLQRIFGKLRLSLFLISMSHNFLVLQYFWCIGLLMYESKATVYSFCHPPVQKLDSIPQKWRPEEGRERSVLLYSFINAFFVVMKECLNSTRMDVVLRSACILSFPSWDVFDLKNSDVLFLSPLSSRLYDLQRLRMQYFLQMFEAYASFL